MRIARSGVRDHRLRPDCCTMQPTGARWSRRYGSLGTYREA